MIKCQNFVNSLCACASWFLHSIFQGNTFLCFQCVPMTAITPSCYCFYCGWDMYRMSLHLIYVTLPWKRILSHPSAFWSRRRRTSLSSWKKQPGSLRLGRPTSTSSQPGRLSGLVTPRPAATDRLRAAVSSSISTSKTLSFWRCAILRNDRIRLWLLSSGAVLTGGQGEGARSPCENCAPPPAVVPLMKLVAR